MNNFKHKIVETVKFHEVDMMGVCNNAVYFNYFEDAKVGYLQNIKVKYELTEVMEGNSFFIMAHNECDYMEPAKFDDKLNIYTKVEYIKKTSFGVTHIVENEKTKNVIARGKGVMVHIDWNTKRPVPIPKEFYKAVENYEEDVKIIKEE